MILPHPSCDRSFMPNTSPDVVRLERLFRQHYAMLLASSERITRDRQLSEDVVQNVFLRFFERDGLRRATDPAAYLRRAVVTRTLNAIRDRQRLSHPGEEAIASATEHSHPYPTDDLAETKEKLHRAINQLPERARLILILHRFEGLSYKEIAAELDISPKTVENQLARSLKLLRALLPKLLSLASFLNFSTL